MINNEIHRYLKAVKKEFPYIGRKERLFFKKLNDIILFDENSIHYDDLIEKYGNPSDILLTYIENNETYLQKKHISLRKIFIIFTSLFFITAFFLLIRYFIKSEQSYINREVVEITYND